MSQNHHLRNVSSIHTSNTQEIIRTKCTLLQRFPIVRRGSLGGASHKINATYDTDNLSDTHSGESHEGWLKGSQQPPPWRHDNAVNCIQSIDGATPSASLMKSSEQSLEPGGMHGMEDEVEAGAVICAVPMLPPVHFPPVCVESVHTQTSPTPQSQSQSQSQSESQPQPQSQSAQLSATGATAVGCRHSRSLRRSTSQLIRDMKKKVGELRRSVSRGTLATTGRDRSHSRDSHNPTPVQSGVPSSSLPSLVPSSSTLSPLQSAPSTDPDTRAHVKGSVHLEFVEPCVDGSYLIQFRRADASVPLGISFTLEKAEAGGVVWGGGDGVRISRLANAPHLVACSKQLRVGDRVLAIQGVPANLLRFEAITHLVKGSLIVTISATHF